MKKNPSQASEVLAVRDLADFHVKWRTFRPMAIDLSKEPLLTLEQRELIIWLVHLADRTGPKDFVIDQ